MSGGDLSAATTVVGVIGDPIAHSLSPRLHNAAFAALDLDWVSVGFRVGAGDTAVAMRGAAALGLRGLSVTMPHKAAAAAVVDRLSHEAERLGAVNCVAYDDGVAVGENTDGAGLVAALRRGAHFDPAGKRCLVVGAGGAARAVVAALADAGATEVVVVNRSADRAAAAVALAADVGRVGRAEDAAQCDLVVNATPIGLGVANGQPPDVADRPRLPRRRPVGGGPRLRPGANGVARRSRGCRRQRGQRHGHARASGGPPGHPLDGGGGAGRGHVAGGGNGGGGGRPPLSVRPRSRRGAG